MALDPSPTRRETRLRWNIWFFGAAAALVGLAVTVGYHATGGEPDPVASRLAQHGVGVTATDCRYLLEDALPPAVSVRYQIDGATRANTLSFANTQALERPDEAVSDGPYPVPAGRAYACPLRVVVDPSTPDVVIAEQDLRHEVAQGEADVAVEGASVLAVLAVVLTGMGILSSMAGRAAARRSPWPGRRVVTHVAVAATGVCAFMMIGAAIELGYDQKPVAAALDLNARGIPAMATSCELRVRDQWVEEIRVAFDLDGHPWEVPLPHHQDIGFFGDDIALADGFHESPELTPYRCPMPLRVDPADPHRVMAERDIVYYVQLTEQRWNGGVLVIWVTASAMCLIAWVIWWPRRDEGGETLVRSGSDAT